MGEPNSHANITYVDVKKMTAELSAPGGGQGPIAEKVNGALISEFRAKGGKIDGEVGTASELLLVTVIGAKTGLERVIPLVYFRIDGRFIVIASMGGAHVNPPWFHNLLSHPDVTVEMNGDTFKARAVLAEGADRDTLFRSVCEIQPLFSQYQERTERRIPVFELTRLS